MSSIFSKLNELVAYYDATRQVGHTTKMLNGAYAWSSDSRECVVLTHNSAMADILNEKIGNCAEAIPFTDNNHAFILTGKHTPILFDNALLHILFKESADRMSELSIENLNLKNQIIYLKNNASKLETENKQLGNDIISLKLKNYNREDTIKQLEIDNNLLKTDNKTLNDFNKTFTNDKLTSNKEVDTITIKFK